jgi:hypothetical protein
MTTGPGRPRARTATDFAVGVGEGIVLIHARDAAVGVIGQVVAQHPFGRDVEMGGDGGDDLAEAAGQDDDMIGVFVEEAQVAAHRRRALVEDAARQFGDVVPGQGQAFEAAAQGLAEGNGAGHGLIGQAGDLGADGVGVGRAGQGDVGQRLQRLDTDEGGVEVENEGRGSAMDGAWPTFAVAAMGDCRPENTVRRVRRVH